MNEASLSNTRSELSDYIFVLDANEPKPLESYLRSLPCFSKEMNLLRVEKAGEGNMNCTLRVKLSNSIQDSIVIKQARPWVEKYPQVKAPKNRSRVEGHFYDLIANHPNLSERMPAMIHQDPENFILIFQDLGAAKDGTDLYQGQQIETSEITVLCDYLEDLHSIHSEDPLMQNRLMRKLNHQHIFDLPFAQEELIDLDQITPGLSALRKDFCSNDSRLETIKALGKMYLSDGKCLLHGDYYPGSWMHAHDQLYILDPEFAFMGRAEFDYGVLLAHLHMAEQAQTILGEFERRAQAKMKDLSLIKKFAATEIARRIFGLAQLPLNSDLNTKKKWVGQAMQWL